MRTIGVGQFKDRCLKMQDEVAKTKTPVVITKRGQPIAKVIPYVKSSSRHSLAGSVLKETGNAFATGEEWDADAS